MIAIIDYGASNLESVGNALSKLNQEYFVAKTPQELAGATKIILPGVGAAGTAMKRLSEAGFIKKIQQLEQPVLGICLGMQLFSSFSEEDMTACLDIMPGAVKKLPVGLKVPQTGWNKVKITSPSPLFNEIPDDEYFYFVHSFYFDAPKEMTVGETNYGVTFSSVVKKNNFYGVQFHPEKSGDSGLQLLRNFCTLC